MNAVNLTKIAGLTKIEVDKGGAMSYHERSECAPSHPAGERGGERCYKPFTTNNYV